MAEETMERLPMLRSGMICLLLLLFTKTVIQAQISDVDEAFEEALELAFDGQYEEARERTAEILEIAPDYHDVRILRARTWLWQGDYDQARPDLDYVLEREPNYRDALAALFDLLNWSGNQEEALEIAEIASAAHPEDGALLYRQARILIELNRYDQAAEVLRQMESIGWGDSDIRALRRVISSEVLNNLVELSYTYDRYSEIFDDWHLFSGRYERMTGFGPVIGRLNLANRFGQSALQGELESYPRLGDNWYGYLNVGASGGEIFPTWRAGAEIHRLLGEGWDLSAGLRYLDFESSHVWIVTGSAGWFTGQWFLQARPYFGFVDDGTTQSFTLLVRRYLESVESHLSLRAGIGFTPEDQQLLGGLDQVEFMRSQFIGLEYYQMLGWRLQWVSAVRFARQEMQAADDYVSILTLMTGLNVRF